MSEYTHPSGEDWRQDILGRNEALQRHGIATVLQPSSEVWQATSPDEKVQIIRDAIAAELDGKKGQVAGVKAVLTVLGASHGLSEDETAPEDVVAAALELAYALGDLNELPVTPDHVSTWREHFAEFKYAGKRRKVTGKLDKAGLLTNQRQVIDDDDSTAFEPAERVQRLHALAASKVPVFDAMAEFYHSYRSMRGYSHVVQSMTANLLYAVYLVEASGDGDG